jgi:hypothetical protein
MKKIALFLGIFFSKSTSYAAIPAANLIPFETVSTGQLRLVLTGFREQEKRLLLRDRRNSKALFSPEERKRRQILLHFLVETTTYLPSKSAVVISRQEINNFFIRIEQRISLQRELKIEEVHRVVDPLVEKIILELSKKRTST